MTSEGRMGGRSKYAVPLDQLEAGAHVPVDDMVEEVSDPPPPDLVREERRQLQQHLSGPGV